jgi:hypothetical protein
MNFFLQSTPRKEVKGQEGSAEAQTTDHDMNYGEPLPPPPCLCLLSSPSVNTTCRHQPGSTPAFLSIVVVPNPPPERAKRQEGSCWFMTCWLGPGHNLNYREPCRRSIPLPTSPSANPPCLHQVGPESGISSTVDVPILPRKEKRARGVCLQIHCLTTLTCTTVNPSMISTDKIPITYHRNADEMPKKYLYRYNTDTISIRYRWNTDEIPIKPP